MDIGAIFGVVGGFSALGLNLNNYYYNDNIGASCARKSYDINVLLNLLNINIDPMISFMWLTQNNDISVKQALEIDWFTK